MNKKKKGTYGYIRSQKVRRFLNTLGLYALAIAIFLVGYFLNDGSRNNIYTVIAVLGIIPASMSLVSMIMMWRLKPMDEGLYEDISACAGEVPAVYELYLTTREQNLYIDAAVVSGESLICYTHENAGPDVIHMMEDHITRSLRTENLKETVRIFQKEKRFLELLSSMSDKYTGEYRERDQKVLEVMKVLAL